MQISSNLYSVIVQANKLTNQLDIQDLKTFFEKYNQLTDQERDLVIEYIIENIKDKVNQ